MAEILVVAFVLLLVFGSSRIPAIGDGLGRAIRGLRGASKDGRKDG